jgi:uncharacterized membrane protein YqhA
MSAMPDGADSEIAEHQPGLPGPRLRDGAERTLTASLWLALLPVAFLLVAALAVFVYAVAVLINALSQIIGHPFPVGHHIGSFLLVFDLFLIGSTALISAIGFYELFIGDIRVGGRDMLPGWLAIHDLNELKSRVVSMIVLVLAVTFAEEAVDSPNALHLLEFGGGITVVIIGLTAFLRWGQHTGEG